jgi:hypothetical protein
MAEQDFKRKLTAILSADAKGYSRLMSGFLVLMRRATADS